MVGVPALDRCDCGPSLRITWPAFTAASLRIRSGPSSSATHSAVSALMIVRNDTYWNRWNALRWPRNRSASSSNMAPASVSIAIAEQRLHDAIHRRAARALNQHGHTGRHIGSQRRDQFLLTGEMSCPAAEGGGGMGGHFADRVQARYALLARERAGARVQRRGVGPEFA